MLNQSSECPTEAKLRIIRILGLSEYYTYGPCGKGIKSKMDYDLGILATHDRKKAVHEGSARWKLDES